MFINGPLKLSAEPELKKEFFAVKAAKNRICVPNINSKKHISPQFVRSIFTMIILFALRTKVPPRTPCLRAG